MVGVGAHSAGTREGNRTNRSGCPPIFLSPDWRENLVDICNSRLGVISLADRAAMEHGFLASDSRRDGPCYLVVGEPIISRRAT